MTFLHNIIKPKSVLEDDRRVEYIVITLLIGSLALTSVTILLLIYSYIALHNNVLRRLDIIIGAFLFLISLYVLARKGKFHLVSHILVILFFLLASAVTLQWGILLPQGMLIFSFVIIMSGILISTRAAITTATFVAFTLICITYMHLYTPHKPNLMWNNHVGNWGDVIALVVTFAIITSITWLSNHEIENSLHRARKSEQALKNERDSLEIKVAERTKQLHQAEYEKMIQLYRFAEFGRLTSSVLHDLVNPLTTVSLNLEILSEKTQSDNLKRALLGVERIEKVIASARQEINQQTAHTTFSLSDEIKQAIDVVSHKAREKDVTIKFTDHLTSKDLYFGSSIKFHQAITNLLSNAIDAYDNDHTKRRIVEISAQKTNSTFRIDVTDTGSGIAQEHIEKIFEPFFSTKSPERGTGIGLSITREIIEKNFSGAISVTSKHALGATFTILIPIHHD